MASSHKNIDPRTIRPREPNIPYSRLTDEQIRNIKKDPSAFFMHDKPECVYGTGREGGRFYIDRYATCVSQYNIRGLPNMSFPCGIIDEKYDRNITEDPRGTSQIDAHFKWEPTQAGERTLGHNYGEKVNDYLTIDCYRRHPTNLPGNIVFKYGRPAGGYYEQRDPSGKLEPSPDVTLGVFKTQADYDKEQSLLKPALTRVGQWPEYSEYTSRYILHDPVEK